MLVTVEVKNEHIKNGQISSCDNCPIALALMDTFHYTHILVTYQHLRLTALNGQKFKIETNSKIRHFMKAFDAQLFFSDKEYFMNLDIIKPFSFDISIEREKASIL